MTSRYNGTAVSGYLDPAGRNWETPVYQSGKPVLDKELNLGEELANGVGQDALKRLMPSGWIAPDFTGSADMTAGIFQYTATADTLHVPNNLTAHVNGWLLKVANTGSTALNLLALPAPSLGVGVKRTDLVILEVWRRLISASPTSAGKSGLGRIWSNGNVKVTTDADPYTLDDDILDTNVGSETTKRVQIQYRLRVVQNVDLEAYPAGLDDPTVVAYTVPAIPGAPDGTPVVAYTYQNQSANGDAGLWVAGDGSLPAQTALGTVDGFMYAIPLMGIVRRNQTAFSRLNNHAGGVLLSVGVSDRPDGLFADVVVSRDIIDLRRGVSPTGWNYQEVLTRNLGFLLDNNLRTEWAGNGGDPVTGGFNGGGYFGHTRFVADEIGLLPGDGTNTGDTPGANFIGQFDSVRQFFSDQPTFELVQVVYSAPSGTWTVGDTVTIDPAALPVYPSAAFSWLSRNPAGACIKDVRNIRWMGEAALKAHVSADAYIGPIVNVGALPSTAVGFMVTSVPPTVTDERLFVELLIEYPPGLGLTYTPTDTWAGSVQNNTPAVLPVGTTIGSGFDYPHREVRLQATYPDVTATFIHQTGDSLLLPERAATLTSVTVGGSPVPGASLSSDGRTILFGSAQPAGATVVAVYAPLRPLPQGIVQLTVYYEARVPQTVREARLPSPLSVVPRHIDTALHVLTVGSGSLDEAYPYPAGYTQLGGIFPSSTGTFAGDHELAAGASLYVAEFNAATGFLRLPAYIAYTPSPNEVRFTRTSGNRDAEGRTFYPESDVAFYDPNAYAQPITDAKRHRNFLAVLAELPADSAIGKKGQLVVLLLVREAMFDNLNGVFFDPNPALHTTSASVFLVRGNLLNKR